MICILQPPKFQFLPCVFFFFFFFQFQHLRQDLIRRELGAVALALSQQQRDTAQETTVQAAVRSDEAFTNKFGL